MSTRGMVSRRDRSTMRRSAVGVAAVSVALATWVSPAAARQTPLRLGLEDAIGFATGSNPTLRQATNDALLNGAEMRATWLDQLLPSASLTLFDTRFDGNLQRRALDNFGNPIANPSAEWNYFSNTTHNLSLSWSIQGLSLFQAHERQQLVNEGRDLAELRARTDLEFEVQRLYVDALEQRELMHAEEALIEARRIDLDVAERLFSLALRTRVDVLNAELAIEQQALTLQQQMAAYERALLALRSAIGLTDESDIEIEDETLPLFDPSGLEATALISRALEANPALLQSDAAIRTAQATLAEERNAWFPQISAGLNVYRQAYEPETAALFDASFTKDLESRFFVRFSIPILNGFFQQDVERQRASVDVSNQREADREARLQLEESIRGALLELENQWASFQVSERSGVIADEALRLAREEYRLGTRSFEDLRSSFQQQADTQRQLIAARYSFVDALLTLEEAVGEPVRELNQAADGQGGS